MGARPSRVALRAKATFRITSPAISDGQAIGRRYTCDGGDAVPPLQWTDPPPSTVSFALLVTDPDAHGFAHWVVYDMPPGARGARSAGRRGVDGVDGRNHFGRLGYGGPCPPPGRPHRYRFTIYALNRPTGLSPGASAAEVLAAIQGHVVARAEIVGTYAR